MKKNLLNVAVVAVLAASVLMTSCKKEETDSSAPAITLNGSSTTYSSLNTAYTDAGATAKDEKDGDLTSKITVSGVSSVNKDLAGTYTITYSVTDAAGNTGTATRSVVVRNDSYALAGAYDVKIFENGSYLQFPVSCGSSTNTSTFVDTVTVSTTVNNRVWFKKFGNYSGNTYVYADVKSTSNITLPANPGVTTTAAVGCSPGSVRQFYADATTSGGGFVSSPVGFYLHVVENTNSTLLNDKFEYTKK